uniref:NACHT, LRR and PYD domains-containing protein 5-like n=2 Tax=Callorhinus ursinus TaxID=34884 RepID=A0A3Q7MCJ4_CALUR|nr:NACHT, LRR and PYD domains-containing protein 5-like [Callorhinus ursinus]
MVFPEASGWTLEKGRILEIVLLTTNRNAYYEFTGNPGPTHNYRCGTAQRRLGPGVLRWRQRLHHKRWDRWEGRCIQQKAAPPHLSWARPFRTQGSQWGATTSLAQDSPKPITVRLPVGWGAGSGLVGEEASQYHFSILLKNPLFHQNLSSQPCTKMREAKLPSFSNYGLQWCFKQLSKEEFQTFKELLMEKASELAMCSFPWVEVNNANVEHLASLLHEHYKESLAWKISIHIFEKMNLSTLSEKARKEMKKYSLTEIPENSTQRKNDQEPSMKEVPEISQAIEQDGAIAAETKEEGFGDNTRDYKGYVMTKFATELDEYRGFENLASDCPEMQTLLGAFSPDQRGFQPRTVVLHGKSGIGKSTLARSVLLCWAQGELFKGMFSYVFFLHASDMQCMSEGSFAELISRKWPDSQVPMMEIMSQPERLLFVVDGFDDLDFASQDDDTNLCKDWAAKQPMSVLMLSLLRKVLLPESSLMITVRDTGIEKLKSMLTLPRYLFVGGISVEKRIQLLLGHMKDEHQKTQVLHSVVDNHPLLDECQVPVLGSLICKALNLREASGKSLPPTRQTLTGLYATFVFHQLTPRDASRHCLNQEERAILKSLCLMAVQGVWNRKFLFYGDDLGVHRLRESELSALFHTNILLQDRGCDRCYMFPHVSLQEFFAALYYVLEGLETERAPYPVFMENMSLVELQQISSNAHLFQMKRFLFGLMSKEVTGALEVLLGCRVPLAMKQGLLSWISLLGQQASTPAPPDLLDAFHCLFETQDEEFVRLALNSFQAVWLPINRRMDLMVSSFCLQHCQCLQKIRIDVHESFSEDEFTEAQPLIPQGTPIKTLADEGWKSLCFVLSTHPSLRQLDLSGSILNEWAMKTLCIKLRQPTCKIQNLIFKGVQVTLGLRHLWLTLITNRNIKYLNLENTHLKDADLMMVCEALRHPNCLLESLRLDHCGLTPACCLVISQILVTSISLKSLSLVGNKVANQGIKPLCNALTASQCTLQKLILGNCGLTAADCQDLASALISNQSLTHLCLSSNSLGSEGVNMLCQAIKLPNCGLQRLILSECSLDVASSGFLAFALMGNKHLTHLSLSMNPVEDGGMNLLCEALMQSSCHLQDLELVKCHLTAACCKKLSHVITRSKHLKSLDLAVNALGDEGIIALCEGLKHRRASLRRLGLEACGLTSGCCEALASALLCSQRLTSLNLMQNNFSPVGMMKLCPAFAQPTSNLQIIGLWKWQYPTQIRKLLEEVQQLKPQIIIGDSWYSSDEDDRYWWKN